jgi:Zn-dependent protease/predicted transcriptional regulator
MFQFTSGQGWQIGRIFGIPIVIHVSWLLVFAFVTWTLATAYLPTALPGQSVPRYWAMGGMAALLLFLSVLLHELGHCWVALRYHVPIGQITLFVFGGVAHMKKEPPTPKAEFLIAIAGPIVSFSLGAACLGFGIANDLSGLRPDLHGLTVLGWLLGTVNLQIGLFNLIPGFPLDGGRALRAGLWAWSKDFHAATRRSAVAGLAFGVLLSCLGGSLMLGAGLHLLETSLITTGMWVAMIGLFLFATAKGTRQQAVLRETLARVTVSELVTQSVISVPAALTIESAVKGYFLPHGFSGFPVMEHDRLVGMVTVQDLQRFPQTLWPWREVRDVMRPWTAEMEISAGATALHALEQMGMASLDRVIVRQEGRIVGVLTRSTVWRYLNLRSQGRSSAKVDPPQAA